MASDGTLMKLFKKIFGSIKKINTSLHCKKIKQIKVSRIQLHIKTANWFSPEGLDTSCGAQNAVR